MQNVCWKYVLFKCFENWESRKLLYFTHSNPTYKTQVWNIAGHYWGAPLHTSSHEIYWLLTALVTYLTLFRFTIDFRYLTLYWFTIDPNCWISIDVVLVIGRGCYYGQQRDPPNGSMLSVLDPSQFKGLNDIIPVEEWFTCRLLFRITMGGSAPPPLLYGVVPCAAGVRTKEWSPCSGCTSHPRLWE